MGKKMSNAPVYYTIAQVQFNPILNWDSYLPDIQSKMREMGFPDYRHEVLQTFTVGGSNAAVQPTFVPQSRFLFGDIPSQTVFELTSNSLALKTTNYDTFESFFATLLRGLDVIHTAVPLAFIERIGIRYFDAVFPSNEDDRLTKYLAPEVVGLFQKMGGKLVHSASETMMNIEFGYLTSRIVIQDGTVGLPPDLVMSHIKILDRFAQYRGRHAIIDTDAYFQQREVFDLGKIEIRLVALHTEIKRAFEIVVTEYAQTQWA